MDVENDSLTVRGPASLKSRVLMILGMHRSGTSLLASWLSDCGLHLGNDLLGEKVGNELGHYEDMDFLRLHEKILKAAGTHRGGIEDFNVGEITSTFYEQMRQLVAQKSRANIQWGWKEPRTCLFVQQYRELIPDAKYIVVYRHYLQVVDSLIRRRLKKKARHDSEKAGLNRFLSRMTSVIWRRWVVRRAVNDYLRAWVRYNENLLSLIKDVDPNNVCVLDCKDFLLASAGIMERLVAWDFELTPRLAADYVDKGMMTESISINYVLNRSLVERGNNILNELAIFSMQATNR